MDEEQQTMQLTTFLQQQGAQTNAEQLWLEFGEGSPAPIAASFRQQRARLIGLTAYPDAGEVMVCYHFALPLGGRERVCTVKFGTSNRLLASIAAVYPGAGWQEEVTAERFGITFTEGVVAGMLA